MYQTTKHGYKIYPADSWHKNPFMFCRDDNNAMEDIRTYLTETRQPLDVHNGFDTFYGCGWGQWLIDGTKDIANAEVVDFQSSRGYGPDFPGVIRLTPKN